MKDLIADRLGRIKDLEERKLLKSILINVFENVADYNMEMYGRLEERIYNEIQDPLDKFYIYSTLEHVKNVDPVSDFMHPILPEDMEAGIYNMEEITEKLQTGEPFVLAAVFMQCSFLKLTEIIQTDKVYSGFVKTDKDVHKISVRLEQSQKYINEIKKLYRIFQYNATAWRTVHCPYAYKFVDIVLVSNLNLKPGEKIMEISADLAEYEKYKLIDVIPLWNVKKIKGQDKSFPMPVIDAVHFEHVISLSEPGVINGYMADIDNIPYTYVKRYIKDLVIVSQESAQRHWNMIQIESIENAHKQQFSYDVLSNKRNLGFTGRFQTLKSVIVRTEGELSRLIHSYELSKELTFYGMTIYDSYDKPKETYDLNDFIDDNIREDKHKKIMLLTFKPADREDFLVLDKMSFLVSEIQTIFPEYRCVGELA